MDVVEIQTLWKQKKTHTQKNEQDIQEIQICLSFLWDS